MRSIPAGGRRWFRRPGASRPTDWALVISLVVVAAMVYFLDDLGATKQANLAECARLESQIVKLRAGRRGFERQIEDARASLKFAMEEREEVVRENQAFRAILMYSEGYDVPGWRSRTVTAGLTRDYAGALWSLSIASNNPDAVGTSMNSDADGFDPTLAADDASILEILTHAAHVDSVGKLMIRGCVIRRAHQDAIKNVPRLGTIELDGCSVEGGVFEVPDQTHSFELRSMKGDVRVQRGRKEPPRATEPEAE